MASRGRASGTYLLLIGLLFVIIGIVIAFNEIPLLVSGRVTRGRVTGIVKADRARRRVAIVEYHDLTGATHTIRTLNAGPQPGDSVDVVFMADDPEHAEDYSPTRQCAAFLLTGAVGSGVMIAGITRLSGSPKKRRR